MFDMENYRKEYRKEYYIKNIEKFRNYYDDNKENILIIYVWYGKLQKRI